MWKLWALLTAFGVAGPAAGLAGNFTSAIMRATFIINGPHAGNPVDRYYGTGFLIETDRKKLVLVSAAHVFENVAGDLADVYFRTRLPNGDFEASAHPISIRQNGAPIYKKIDNYDIAAITIEMPSGLDESPIPETLLLGDTELRKFNINPGVEVLSLGFPLENTVDPKEAFPIVRRGTVTSFHLFPERGVGKFAVSLETFEGESGGPVYLDGGPNKCGIIGLISSDLSDTATKTRLHVAWVLYSALIRDLIDSM